MKQQLIRLNSLDNCQLSIGSFPPFIYNAIGGGGNASISSSSQGNDLYMKFQPDKFLIPPLNWKTTKVFSLPMPPGLNISIIMEKLEGSINNKNGDILLDFEAKFVFTIWPTWQFPDLIVKTYLGTKKVKSKLYNIEGKTLNKNGRATLVGIARILPTGNNLLDSFLGLPNEALAVLECIFTEI